MHQDPLRPIPHEYGGPKSLETEEDLLYASIRTSQLIMKIGSITQRNALKSTIRFNSHHQWKWDLQRAAQGKWRSSCFTGL